MSVLVSLIEALAKLAWPSVVFIALLWFRKDLSALLTRTRKAKVLGNEFEFEAEKEKLSEGVREVLQAADVQQKKEQVDPSRESEDKFFESPHIGTFAPSYDKLDYDWKYLEEKIGAEPAIAVFIISSQIEKLLRLIEIRSGNTVSNKGISTLASNVARKMGYPASFQETLRTFVRIRNAIAHGYNQSNENEIMEVARSGFELLKFVYERQPQPIFVQVAGLYVFEDEECQKPLEMYEGLELIFAAVPGTTGMQRIEVTKRRGYYREGMEVTAKWQGAEWPENVWVKNIMNNKQPYKVSIKTFGYFDGDSVQELLIDGRFIRKIHHPTSSS